MITSCYSFTPIRPFSALFLCEFLWYVCVCRCLCVCAPHVFMSVLACLPLCVFRKHAGSTCMLIFCWSICSVNLSTSINYKLSHSPDFPPVQIVSQHSDKQGRENYLHVFTMLTCIGPHRKKNESLKNTFSLQLQNYRVQS